MAKRSAYQERVIRNYYKNQDTIMLQRVGDLVTDLYLSEGKSRDRLWKRIAEALAKLEVPEKRIKALVATDDPAKVADLLRQLLSKLD